MKVNTNNIELKIAADMEYMRRHGDKTIEIMNPEHCERGDERFTIESDRICIHDLKFCMNFIQRFGHLVTKINHSHWRTEDVHRILLDGLINEYCDKSLYQIKFGENDEESMVNIRKPFEKVEAVHFFNYTINSRLSDLNRWFPNMSFLDLCGSRVSNRRGFEAHYPKLQHLIVTARSPQFDSPDKNYKNIEIRNISEILRLNPQIQSFYIYRGCYDGIDAKYFHSVVNHLQQLENFEIDACPNFFNLDDGTLHFSNVKKFQINYMCDSPIEEITFSFDALDELAFVSCSSLGNNRLNYALSNKFFNFISKQKSLTKLTLKCKSWRTPPTFYLSKKYKEMLALPSLVEANLNSCTFSIEDVVMFIEKCPALKRFYFKLDERDRYENLQKQLNHMVNGTWHASIDANNFIELNRSSNLSKTVLVFFQKFQTMNVQNHANFIC